MGGMYKLQDLLLLAVRESAEDLLLEPENPPRMRLHGKVRVLDGPSLTSDQIDELLRSIATDEQRRELEVCGDAHFTHGGEHGAQFNVHARMKGSRVYLTIKYLSRR